MKSNILKYSLIFTYIFLTYLLLLISIQYIPLNYDVAFLRIKQDEIQNDYYKIAFFTHVYTSIFLMLFGGFQFFIKPNIKKYTFHRISGKIYVFILLFLSGPSGLIMSYHANGNWVSKSSFLLLSSLWVFFTAKMWIDARKKDFISHRNFAIRSFALTLSAISLRLFKYLIVFIFHTPPMDTYKIVAWLGWTFNLLIAELIIFYKTKKT